MGGGLWFEPLVLGVVVANCSGDHFRRTRSGIRVRRSIASFAAASAWYGTAVATQINQRRITPCPHVLAAMRREAHTYQVETVFRWVRAISLYPLRRSDVAGTHSSEIAAIRLPS